jgi:hypothetical protein
VNLIRRLLTRTPAPGPGRDATSPGATVPEASVPEATPAEIEAVERDRERDLLRGEAGRLDELRQRQLRYADYSWTPPVEGGDRRADDEDATGDAG